MIEIYIQKKLFALFKIKPKADRPYRLVCCTMPDLFVLVCFLNYFQSKLNDLLILYNIIRRTKTAK